MFASVREYVFFRAMCQASYLVGLYLGNRYEADPVRKDLEEYADALLLEDTRMVARAADKLDKTKANAERKGDESLRKAVDTARMAIDTRLK